MREHKDPTWRVNNIDIEWYRGRDHQVVNPHRSGRIEITVWTGRQNSSRTLRYYFAAGDVVENDISSAANTPEDKKVAWMGDVVEGGYEVEINDEVPEEWTDVINRELEWLGFEIVEEPPSWHYTQQ